MISAAEMQMQLKMTRAFIAADETIVSIYRRTRAATGTGGFTEGPRTLVGQVAVRLVPGSANTDPNEELSTTDGRRYNAKYTLTAMPDSGIKRYDEFEWKGQIWKVHTVHYMPEYILKGDVGPDGLPPQ